VAGLPAPEPARPHDGFDAAALTAEAASERVDGLEVVVEPGAARIAVASSTGVRAAEQRSHHVVRVRGAVGGRNVEVVRAGVAAPDRRPALAEARELLEAGHGEAPPDTGPVVLGHAAVAAVLDRLRPAFGAGLALGSGPLAGRRGTRVAAPSVNLSDSSRYPGTLPRSFDAEGVPRRPVALIQDGVAHRAVLDTAAAQRTGEASTGHATRAGALAPYPEHLVLVGGGADDIAALAAPVADGLYVPALGRDGEGRPLARGAVRIRGGRLAGGVDDRPLEVDPLAVLAGVEALTAAQRLVPLAGHCPGGLGAAMVPALRTAAGVRW
jgi:PmbA protein